ncbi:CAP domain-containing protein [Janthinobacterium sp.]|uniref:CAP domain-containing protein n=1 Tax=Janthinobacterium sp. TaxID=1871054 RepID=UPI00293D9B30|nr:CAP domain-containing protein [Janthinobacterium sp.]
MALSQRCKLLISALLMTGLLSACGGGGGGTADSGSNVNTAVLLNTTADQGFNWINTRRQQIGIPTPLKRDTVIDKAAQNHSIYQVSNNIITHDETSGLTGFTGVDQLARLKAVGYTVAAPYLFGEVIARAPNSDGAFLAEELIAAIYHRFLIFEPLFKDAGSGAAISRSGDVYFTTNFAANKGYGVGIGNGKIVNYPYDGQSGVPTSFLSDSEEPDPVPDRNEVGYPISVHSDATGTLTVNNFTVRLRGAGSDLPVRLLTADTDPNTQKVGPTAAAIIPLAPLLSGQTYDVAFSGVANSIAVTRNWFFSTK